MINPFVISSVAEQAALEAHRDGERWSFRCRALGATPEQCLAYNADALRYAATTLYPNHLVVAYARKLALEVLMRGEPMPTSAEQAIEAENARQLTRWGR